MAFAPVAGNIGKFLENPLQAQCLQGVFKLLLWKNLWTMWKTYVYRTTEKWGFQQVMSTCVPVGHEFQMGGIPCNEGVAVLVWEYVFWLAATALVVIGLGRLKRWLLRKALGQKKKRPEDQGV